MIIYVSHHVEEVDSIAIQSQNVFRSFRRIGVPADGEETRSKERPLF